MKLLDSLLRWTGMQSLREAQVSPSTPTRRCGLCCRKSHTVPKKVMDQPEQCCISSSIVSNITKDHQQDVDRKHQARGQDMGNRMDMSGRAMATHQDTAQEASQMINSAPTLRTPSQKEDQKKSPGLSSGLYIVLSRTLRHRFSPSLPI